MNSTSFKTSHFPVNDKTTGKEQTRHSSEKLCSLQNLDRPALLSASEQNKVALVNSIKKKISFPQSTPINIYIKIQSYFNQIQQKKNSFLH